MAGIDYGNILNSGDTTNDGYIVPCRTYIELTLHRLHNVPKKQSGGGLHCAPRGDTGAFILINIGF